MATTFKASGTELAHVFFGVGHGGSDPGAVDNNLVEANLNLKQATYAKEVCVAHGVTVTMSRTRDEDDDLSEEIREANESGASLAVDFHTNAGGGDGFEAFYTRLGGLGKTLAQNIETEVKAIGQNSRGIKTKLNSSGSDYFGFIRSTTMPAIITEMAFIDNINDIKDFDEEHELKAYGTAVAKGILKTLGITYNGNGNVNATTAPSKGLYRVTVDSKNVGAFGVPGNVLNQVKAAIENSAGKILIERV